MNKENNNLEFWSKVCKTPINKTKNVKQGGMSYTTINAQYQLKQATDQFGVYGVIWGLYDLEHELINIDDEILLVLSATFRAKASSFPITNSIYLRRKTKSGLRIDTDAYKKLETDTLTKALSKLGFNADIFEGLYDDPNYLKNISLDTNLQNIDQEYKPTLPIAKNDQIEYLEKNLNDSNKDQLLKRFFSKCSVTQKQIDRLEKLNIDCSHITPVNDGIKN